ncbi:MAG: hypothetical protein EBS91_00160 [Betaproteobacteria bacterium]|jgi:hypothetical protein|nr:hypothetical protein [Betaproteobacteria bacterium]NCA23048.1 hypothetical protein [Betaproteobacteria bacterium]
MTVSRALCDSITEEILAAAKAVLAKHGLELSKSRAGYGDIYSLKVEANAVARGENGVNMASEYAVDYKRFAASYGLKPDLLGKKFTSRGTEYAFAGIASSRRKYPIAALNLVEDKMYFFTSSIVPAVNA